MGSFGERMRREREMRGITLEEIAESTKIGTRSLRALEQEDFDKLPGGIFNKGFVRAYARYLGIDEEQAVADYMGAFGEHDPQPLPEPPPPDPAAMAASSSRRSFLAVVLALVVLAGVGWKLYPRFSGAAGESQPAPAPVAVNPAPPAAAAPEVTASASATADGIVVHISAREQSWIAVSADDQPVSEATLGPQTEKTVRARSRLVVKIGNVRGVELSYNGQPIEPPQGASNVATLTFTPEGVQR